MNGRVTKKRRSKQTNIKSIPNELYSETVQCSMPEFLKLPVSKAHIARQSAWNYRLRLQSCSQGMMGLCRKVTSGKLASLLLSSSPSTAFTVSKPPLRMPVSCLAGLFKQTTKSMPKRACLTAVDTQANRFNFYGSEKSEKVYTALI